MELEIKKPLFKVGDFVGTDCAAEINDDKKHLYPFIKGKIIAVEPPEEKHQSYEYLIEVSESNQDFKDGGDWESFLEDGTYLTIEADIYTGKGIEEREKQIQENIIRRAACHGIGTFLDRLLKQNNEKYFAELSEHSNILQQEIMNGDWDIDCFRGPVEIKEFRGYGPKFVTKIVYS